VLKAQLLCSDFHTLYCSMPDAKHCPEATAFWNAYQAFLSERYPAFRMMLSNKDKLSYPPASRSFNFKTSLEIMGNVVIWLGYEAGLAPKTPGRVKVLFNNVSETDRATQQKIDAEFGEMFPSPPYRRVQMKNSRIYLNEGYSNDLTVSVLEDFGMQKDKVEEAMELLNSMLLRLVEKDADLRRWYERVNHK